MNETISSRMLRSAATSRKRRKLAGIVLRHGAPLLRSRPAPNQPVFILGSPRSGTTLVFDVLNRSPRVASLEVESHLFWEMFHELPQSGWTHELDAGDSTPRERKILYWSIDRLTAGGRRYLDKAPRNCLRVPYLHALFPGAWFVYVKRDGRAVVSSLITGWRHKGNMFPGMEMPVPLKIDGYQGATWKFLVPRGWEDYAQRRSLEQVCAFQWIRANESLLAAREDLGIERWVEVGYEDFVDSPMEETTRLMNRLGLPPSDAVADRTATLGEHVTKAVTPPSRDKWRRENPREIERILPVIEPMMRRLGYQVEDRGPGN